MGILPSHWLRTGLVFFGILLLIYIFSNENGSSSISDHLNSENSRKSSPVVVRKKVSLYNSGNPINNPRRLPNLINIVK